MKDAMAAIVDAPAPEPERIQGWRCIGCGKVDAPRPCIGVCQDKRVELVLAEDYAEMAWRVEQLQDTLALIARITRASMLEVLQLDYIRTANAKGLATDRVPEFPLIVGQFFQHLEAAYKR